MLFKQRAYSTISPSLKSIGQLHEYTKRSIYPFYMFLAAKTFSVHRRVRNYYTKRILNLILNRKNFCGGETRL